MDDSDVWMFEGGRGARLTREPVPSFRIGDERRRQYFERDLGIQPSVAGAIDCAHSTGAKWREDFVRSKMSPGGQSPTELPRSGVALIVVGPLGLEKRHRRRAGIARRCGRLLASALGSDVSPL